MASSTWNCQCNNVEWLGSITTCIHDYANSTEEMNHGYEHIVKRCNVRAKTHYTLEDMKNYQANATSYLKDSELFPKGTNITNPISVRSSVFRWWYKTFRDFNYFISMCERLGWGVVGFWIGVVGLAGIYNYIGYRFVPYKIKQFSQKYLTNKYDFLLFGLNRLEGLICFLFFLTVLLMCCIKYDLELNAYLYSSWFLTLDCISFRTDIIAFSLMPVLYLMGIRNNPFQYFGLMSHKSMINYHKFVAVVFFVLALVHSIIWTAYARSKDGGGYSVWATDAYFYWGIVGMTVVGLMLGFSIEIVRNIYYEIFLFFHMSFSVLFVAAMWKHCNTLGWMGWVYSMAAILVFDRVCRVIRIFTNGFINKAKMDIYNQATVKLEIVQPRGLVFFPGAYVYLHFLDSYYSCWQSHPFSLIESCQQDDNKLVIYLKCKKGMTRKLLKFKDKEYINILIDGPYGNYPVATQNNETFSEIIGIGGGMGVSSVLTFFNHKAKSNHGMSKYKLHWLINDLTQLDMLKDNLQWLVNNGVKVSVYFTRFEHDVKNNGELDTESDEKKTMTETHTMLFEVIYGKPSLEELLPPCNERRKIYVCGPDTLVKNIRNQVGDWDELHVENHTW